MLKDLNLKAVYRSDHDNILEDFYIPALSHSTTYDRAVGFFSASMLSYAAQGLSAFIENDGRMRLIIGGDLEPEDERAIREGYQLREINARLSKQIIQTIEEVKDTLFYKRVEGLSWLVASGHLDIKVALRKKGMYHEKIGILTDANGDKIVFQGAANETASALLPDFNFESINVFQCWRKEFSEHFMPYIVGFENLWQNKTPNTLVLDFPDAAKEKLVKIASRIRSVMPKKIEVELWNKLKQKDDILTGSTEKPSIPEYLNGEIFEIREHQRKGLVVWKANDCKGILAHATGAGKTITAIYGALKIFEATKKLFLIVAVPYQNLADQWVSVLKEFNINSICCYGNSQNWTSILNEYVFLYQTGALNFVCVVVVNRTLQSLNFQNFLQQIPGEHLLWIGDECHHHGALGLSRCLPQKARLRLGLSATPEHYLNTAATQRLIDFYGPVLDIYGLEQALHDGILTPYRYNVVLVDLTPQEVDEFYKISDQISKLTAISANESLFLPDDDQLKFLLFKRARLLSNASQKVDELKKLLREKSPKPFTLFYCGDGSTEDEDSELLIRQVEVVTQLLYDLGWKSSQFTSRETRENRKILLDNFRLSIIDALVAIRCLDEGIDVPACNTAYILASSRNPKQFIQRRGRILRRAFGKEFSEIYDFVVKIPDSIAIGNQQERQLIKAELERVAEFSRLAMNSAEPIKILREIMTKYDLMHLLV